MGFFGLFKTKGIGPEFHGLWLAAGLAILPPIGQEILHALALALALDVAAIIKIVF